jgi:hypothetical protein
VIDRTALATGAAAVVLTLAYLAAGAMPTVSRAVPTITPVSTPGVPVRRVEPVAVPERPDRLFVALPLDEIRFLDGAAPLALPREAAELVRGGFEGPYGADRWRRFAAVRLDYRLPDGRTLVLVGDGPSTGRPSSISWTAGSHRYELASHVVAVDELRRLATRLGEDDPPQPRSRTSSRRN